MRYPSKKSLYDLYKLQKFNEKDFVFASQQVRWDARLGQILVRHIEYHWRDWDALKFHESLKLAECPQIMGVLLAFVPNYDPLFKAWASFVMSGIPPINASQSFFIPQSLPKIQRLIDEVENTTLHYLKWGFYGNEDLSGKMKFVDNYNQKTLLTKPRRQSILLKLAKSKKWFSLKDYLIQCQGRVSVRVAQKDLADCAGLKKMGNTKAARWTLT